MQNNVMNPKTLVLLYVSAWKVVRRRVKEAAAGQKDEQDGGECREIPSKQENICVRDWDCV